MNKNVQLLALASFLFLTACQEKTEQKTTDTQEIAPLAEQRSEPEEKKPDFILSPDHQVNTLTLDIDGDGKPDHMEIVKSTIDDAYGITIKRGDGNFAIIGPLKGSTHRILPEDMEDLSWAQDAYVQDKNTAIYEVTDEDGELREEDSVPDDEKIIVPNESIHLTVPESCGSGMIYWMDGTYHWHQTS